LLSFQKGEFFGEEVLAKEPAVHRVIAKVRCKTAHIFGLEDISPPRLSPDEQLGMEFDSDRL
jgi:hypothetical protein